MTIKVLVTGANRGIGLELCRQLAARGEHVIAVCRRANDDLRVVLGLAWDCGAVTTGPVTVPLVLSMGLGFGNAVEAIEGFGILSMASIGPILSVLVVGLWINWKVARKHRRYDDEMRDPPKQTGPLAPVVDPNALEPVE